MPEGTSPLPPEALFRLGVDRAERDLDQGTAAIRVAEDAGRISATEGAEKRVALLIAYHEEVSRLRARYLS